MLKYVIGRKLDAAERELGASLDYVRHILRTSFSDFLDFTKVLKLAERRGVLPADVRAVAGLVATRAEGCGSCVQIAINQGLAAGVPSDVLRAAFEDRVQDLPPDAALGQRFARYQAANDRFARDRVLAPVDVAAKWANYRVGDRGVAAAPRTADPFGVREVRAPEAAPPGPIDVEVLLCNGGAAVSEEFVPLLVLSDEAGRELGEFYGKAIRLTPGARQQMRIAVAAGGLAPGRYYLAAIASHPVTGRRVGASRYRIPLQIRG